MKVAIQLYWMMFVQYGILTFGMRAVTTGNYIELGLTDMVVAALGFTILKKVEEATTTLQMMSYALGGTMGAQLALWVSLHYIK